MMSQQGYSWQKERRSAIGRSVPYLINQESPGVNHKNPGGNQCRLEIYVPIKRCGLLIGKGGSMFKELQQEFGVQLKVPHHSEPEGTLTTIEGSDAAVDACLSKISQAVHGEVTIFNRTTNSSVPPPDVPQVIGATLPSKQAPVIPQKIPVSSPKAPSLSTPQVLAKPAHQMLDGRIGNVQEQIELCGDFEHPLVGKLRLARHQGEDQSNLYVMNIPSYVDELGLYLLFAPFGAVNSVHVVRDKINLERHGGIGFVRFASSQAAAQATLFMNGTALFGAEQPLEVGLHKVKTYETCSGDQREPATAPIVLPNTAPLAKVPALHPMDTIHDAVYGDQAPCWVELAIPIHRCGLLIGPGGAVFKELQLNYGVTLKVPQKSDPEGALTIVSGPASAVSACCAEIARHVHGDCAIVNSSEDSTFILDSMPTGPNVTSNLLDPVTRNQVLFENATMPASDLDFAAASSGGQNIRIEVHIPIIRCGLLIGKGGSVFKELQQQYGVVLKVPHHSQPDGTLTVLEGPADAAEACLQEIERKVKGDCTVVDRKAANPNEVSVAGSQTGFSHGDMRHLFHSL